MSLNLDARQRAMLDAMHVKVWWPKRKPVHAHRLPEPEGQVAATAIAAPQPVMLDAPAAGRAAPVPQEQPRTAQVPSASSDRAPNRADTGLASGATALSLQAPFLLYPQVDPAQTPASLGAGWLLVAEADGSDAQTPFPGTAGRLLDNMLRAMQLHRHSRVYRVGVARTTAPEADGVAPDLSGALATVLEELRPSVVLAMGRVAAQALLQRSEPLGQLRGQVHTVHGVPLVATFEAPYLLRAQADKARAWVDLCLALQIAEDGDQPSEN